MTRSCSRAHGGLIRHHEDSSSNVVGETAQVCLRRALYDRRSHQSRWVAGLHLEGLRGKRCRQTSWSGRGKVPETNLGHPRPQPATVCANALTARLLVKMRSFISLAWDILRSAPMASVDQDTDARQLEAAATGAAGGRRASRRTTSSAASLTSVALSPRRVRIKQGGLIAAILSRVALC